MKIILKWWETFLWEPIQIRNRHRKLRSLNSGRGADELRPGFNFVRFSDLGDSLEDCEVSKLTPSLHQTRVYQLSLSEICR
jgi:hypothetical protein